MSITSTLLRWETETFDDAAEGSRSYQRGYRVVSNDPEETTSAVKAVVPALGAAHPDDGLARVVSRTARRLDSSRLVWDVTVSYEFDPQQEEEDPLDRAAVIRWSAAMYQRPVIADLNGEAIVNSAGDYFDPPPEIEDVRWTVNVQKNLSAVPAAIQSFAGAVNNAGFTVDGIGVGTGLGRVVGLEISEVKVEGIHTFRTVTFAIEIRPEGWDLELLDQGFRIKVSGEQKDILMEDEDGNKNRPSSPLLLDGSGLVLADPTPANAMFRDFSVYPTADFSGLPLS